MSYTFQFLAQKSAFFLSQAKQIGSLPQEDDLPVIKLKDVTKAEMMLILRFLYPCKVTIAGWKFFIRFKMKNKINKRIVIQK